MDELYARPVMKKLKRDFEIAKANLEKAQRQEQRRAEKKAKKEPKRVAKQQRKAKMAQQLQAEEDEELKNIVRKTYREHLKKTPTRRRFDFDKQLPPEGREIQRRARDDIVSGKQSCLDLGWLRGQKCGSKTTAADRQAL